MFLKYIAMSLLNLSYEYFLELTPKELVKMFTIYLEHKNPNYFENNRYDGDFV